MLFDKAAKADADRIWNALKASAEVKPLSIRFRITPSKPWARISTSDMVIPRRVRISWKFWEGF